MIFLVNELVDFVDLSAIVNKNLREIRFKNPKLKN